MNVNKPKEDYTRYLIIGLILTAIILVAIGLYVALESTQRAEAAEISSKEAVSEGRKIYQEQCATCHGAQGEGGVGTALNNKKLLQNTVDDVLFSVIRSGVPSTQMPTWSVAYGGPLTDQDVRNVVEFIRSWEPTAPVIEPEVFVPSAERGLLLFNTACAVCHGIDGVKGLDGEPRSDRQALVALDDETFKDAIVNGLPAKGMPGYDNVLSAEQLEDLTALVGAWRDGQEIAAPYDITDEVTAAIFALHQEDPDSAKLRLQNAMSVASGVAAQMLSDINGQLDAGDLPGALAGLVSFNKQWPIGDPTVGQPLYIEKCAPCHGQNGEGGIGTVLNPNEFVSSKTNAEMVAFLLEGRPGTAMAGWKGRLSIPELADIVAFLRTWTPMP
jgi:mono/diheme cytochrome c family protein